MDNKYCTGRNAIKTIDVPNQSSKEEMESKSTVSEEAFSTSFIPKQNIQEQCDSSPTTEVHFPHLDVSHKPNTLNLQESNYVNDTDESQSEEEIIDDHICDTTSKVGKLNFVNCHQRRKRRLPTVEKYWTRAHPYHKTLPT